MKLRYVALLILIVAIAPGLVAQLCHTIAVGALQVAETAVNGSVHVGSTTTTVPSSSSGGSHG